MKSKSAVVNRAAISSLYCCQGITPKLTSTHEYSMRNGISFPICLNSKRSISTKYPFASYLNTTRIKEKTILKQVEIQVG